MVWNVEMSPYIVIDELESSYVSEKFLLSHVRQLRDAVEQHRKGLMIMCREDCWCFVNESTADLIEDIIDHAKEAG